MSEILGEEVDYGSYGVNAFSLTDSDHAWSTYTNMIVKTKWQGNIDLLKSIYYLECSS